MDADASARESLGALVISTGWRTALFPSAGEFLAHPLPVAPSCVVLSVGIRDLGPELQEFIVDERARLPIIFITGDDEVSRKVQALKPAAIACLKKPLVDSLVLEAIRGAIDQSRASMEGEVVLRRLRTRYASLGPRERQVMTLAASGQLNKQIGEALGISETSVKAHRGQVMRKMVAASPADLVDMAEKLRPSPELP